MNEHSKSVRNPHPADNPTIIGAHVHSLTVQFQRDECAVLQRRDVAHAVTRIKGQCPELDTFAKTVPRMGIQRWLVTVNSNSVAKRLPCGDWTARQ